MLVCSLDIETSGLDPNSNQIIEFAAVIENTENIKPIEELPFFSKLVLHPKYTWDVGAFEMNREIWEEILLEHKQFPKFIYTQKAIGAGILLQEFRQFLLPHGLVKDVVVAGKNFTGFDLKFIEKLPGYSSGLFNHRVLDPAILFVDFKRDKVPPNLSKCLERAGLDNKVSHRAISDARATVALLRTKYVK